MSATLSATMKAEIEADAELADQIGVLGAIGSEPLEELARA